MSYGCHSSLKKKKKYGTMHGGFLYGQVRSLTCLLGLLFIMVYFQCPEGFTLQICCYFEDTLTKRNLILCSMTLIDHGKCAVCFQDQPLSLWLMHLWSPRASCSRSITNPEKTIQRGTFSFDFLTSGFNFDRPCGKKNNSVARIEFVKVLTFPLNKYKLYHIYAVTQSVQ